MTVEKVFPWLAFTPVLALKVGTVPSYSAEIPAVTRGLPTASSEDLVVTETATIWNLWIIDRNVRAADLEQVNEAHEKAFEVSNKHLQRYQVQATEEEANRLLVSNQESQLLALRSRELSLEALLYHSECTRRAALQKLP